MKKLSSRQKRKLNALIYWHNLGHKRCKYCHCQLVYNGGQKNSATVEHLVPKSKGGTEALINMIVVCYTCNNKRGDKNFHQWVKGRPLQDWLVLKYHTAVSWYDAEKKELKISRKM